MRGEPNRRRFLTLAGGSALVAALPLAGATAAPRRAVPRLSGDPFTLGVASGEPLPDGVVLWTRLAPEPLAPDGLGGMPPLAVPVDWQLAADPRFRHVVRSGVARATPELGHSVHVEVDGLRPDREYWYRFRAAGHLSETGRTRTAPAVGAALSSLTFAYLSCQNYFEGHFTALRHLADEDLDLVVHLGDYIYEISEPSEVGRDHLPVGEPGSLADYRVRYGQYKSDGDLRAAHAAAPWIVTMDDHEVDNDWAAGVGGEGEVGEGFLALRAAAFQAYYEHLPLRGTARPTGPDMALHRRFDYGGLARFHVLDGRQFRDDQVCYGPGLDHDCADRLAADRSMLGAAQERWLTEGLRDSGAVWDVLANQVLMMQADAAAGPERDFGMDTWDGYAAARDRLFRSVRDNRVENFVVLTGDAHRNLAADLKADFDDPESVTVGAEFMATSITSSGDGEDHDEWGRRWLAENPHMRFHNGQRGYGRCHVTRDEWRTDYRIVPYVSRPGAPVSTRASVYVAAGEPGIAQVES
ncbi:alkaline phosphatase D family protein [Streptomyces millisiae]|uniref:Alkaline phosphatase D family protein n=1 Tax=Streptomyces millisiae TaxID=3075542 RepID=A0ABU2LI89_9ACTN|nr:alkaline phosphatase D family protein [Streptomyces sp. DSM 44918]MDT0317304.1 alkaline phosphatase D family protein [Streptomyces sp. DSM 44918]